MEEMQLKYNTDGLIPVIIQHAVTGMVLMLGYMNETAFSRTVNEGRVIFFSRSRQKLWLKGESSGNFLRVRSIHIDCDLDTLLVKALPDGPTCHTGAESCFFSTILSKEENNGNTGPVI